METLKLICDRVLGVNNKIKDSDLIIIISGGAVNIDSPSNLFEQVISKRPDWARIKLNTGLSYDDVLNHLKLEKNKIEKEYDCTLSTNITIDSSLGKCLSVELISQSLNKLLIFRIPI